MKGAGKKNHFINSKKIKFDLMSYSESDNRLMSNNLSPWGCFEDFCRKKKKKRFSWFKALYKIYVQIFP